MPQHRIRHIRLDSAAEAVKLLESINVDPQGIEAMLPKTRHLNVRIDGLSCKTANILKQEMLSLGGDAAVARGAVGCTIPETDALLMGTEKQLRRLQAKLARQPFGMKALAESVGELLDRLAIEGYVWKTSHRDIAMGPKTLLMAILNVTPDSFSDGGNHFTPEKAIECGLKLAEAGADIIDVGGESSRPGSEPISAEEELRRVVPVVKALSKRLTIPLSIDTTKAAVAYAAMQSGAEIINDISAMQMDRSMAAVAAESKAGVVLMHMRGLPKTMQTEYVPYENVAGDTLDFLRDRMNTAIDSGIREESLVLDPGIGFGKSVEDNLSLLKHLSEFKALGRPVLVGVSRKAFIGRLTEVEEPAGRLEGTIAAVTAAILGGASVVRVHDVQAMKKAIAVADAIRCAG